MQTTANLGEPFANLFHSLAAPSLLIDKVSDKICGWNVAFEKCFSRPDSGACWQAVLQPEALQSENLQSETLQSETLQSETLQSGILQSGILHLSDISKARTPYRLHCIDVDRSTACLVFEAMPLEDRGRALLQHALRGTGARVGTDYFQHCVQTLSEAFRMSYVFIAIRKSDEPSINTVAFFGNGAQLPNFSYDLEGTPCWAIYEHLRVEVYTQNVQQAFPEDEDLVKLGAESYVGIPILNEQNRVVGHLAMLDTQPARPLSDEEEMILKVFAERTGAEFRRLDIEADLRRAKQVAEEASQSKTRFLANISHELRSPLNAVLGFAQLLSASAGLGDQERTMAQTISRNGEHLQSMINNILDMSRIELTDIQPTVGSVRIQEILDDVHATIVPLAQAKNLPVHLLIGTAVPEVVAVDRSMVRQILTNLMVNAVSATESGQVRLSTTTRTVDGATLLAFEVADTGIGIAEEKLPGLFLPFEQANPHSAGSGLGLSIASSYASALGGSIDATSELGRGSTFTLLLPATSVDHVAAKSECPVTDRVEATVLVVDDTESNRSLARRAMELHGFRVEEAADGPSAIDNATSLRPDAILMDLRMPGMDGAEAARQIREQLGKNAPAIIGVTGNLVDAHGQRMESSEFDETIGKPYKIAKLAETVRRHLRARCAGKERDAAD